MVPSQVFWPSVSSKQPNFPSCAVVTVVVADVVAVDDNVDDLVLVSLVVAVDETDDVAELESVVEMLLLAVED